jgi:hypothetical protein
MRVRAAAAATAAAAVADTGAARLQISKVHTVKLVCTAIAASA